MAPLHSTLFLPKSNPCHRTFSELWPWSAGVTHLMHQIWTFVWCGRYVPFTFQDWDKYVQNVHFMFNIHLLILHPLHKCFLETIYCQGTWRPPLSMAVFILKVYREILPLVIPLSLSPIIRYTPLSLYKIKMKRLLTSVDSFLERGKSKVVPKAMEGNIFLHLGALIKEPKIWKHSYTKFYTERKWSLIEL